MLADIEPNLFGFHFADLRQINIEVNHSNACNFRPQPHPGQEVLSGLAGALAFARLPELQLQVFRIGHEELDPQCCKSLLFSCHSRFYSKIIWNSVILQGSVWIISPSL